MPSIFQPGPTSSLVYRFVRGVVFAYILCVFIMPSSHAESAWPAFRGPHGNGHAGASGDEASEGLPLHWSEQENVTWKIPIPHKGHSTPVVMNGRVWLTTATEGGNDFFAIAVDAESGEILFNERVFHSDNPEPLGNNVNTYASPSPVLEAGRVYVHFGSYGTACIDTATLDVLWKRDNLPCRHYRGPGSSPVLFEDLLILTMDGIDLQYITALDKTTGETVWRTDRTTAWTDIDDNGNIFLDGDFRKGFSTPLVVDVAGKPLLLNLGSYAVYGYDARTGREIWNMTNEGHTPSTSPIMAANLAFTATGYADETELRAIRLDGQGDVTDTHLAWTIVGEEKVPYTPSPIAVDDLLYLVSDRGIVTCVEIESGAVVWSERIGGNYQASPVYAGGRLYIFSAQGKATVLEKGRSFNVLATNQLDAGFWASPAVVGNSLYVRSRTHLYRIN